MYETFLRISKMVDIMYEAYEKREKERAENDAPSTPSNVHSLPSSSSHHSNEEINYSLQADHAELKIILREDKEDKNRVQLQLQGIEAALE